MLPYIHFLGRTMPTYGFMMLVGILLSMGLCILRSRRFAPQRSAESVCYQYLILAGSALLGAKIYSLILVWPSLTSNISLLWTDTQLFLQMYVYGGMVFLRRSDRRRHLRSRFVAGPQNHLLLS